MAQCILNGCEIEDDWSYCPECGAEQPGSELATERAYWKSRRSQPVLDAVNATLDNMGDAVLVIPPLHEEFLDCVDARVA